MRLCCTDHHLCKHHQPPADNPSGPIYLGKGEEVRKNIETGEREIYVPDHSGKGTTVGTITTAHAQNATTEPTWTGMLF